jgi:hypothetical protein
MSMNLLAYHRAVISLYILCYSLHNCFRNSAELITDTAAIEQRQITGYTSIMFVVLCNDVSDVD